MAQFLILLVSLVIIVITSDKLIDSSSKIAKFYGVPTFIIGVSIIAFGTSAPELVVGIISSIQKTNQLSYGNIVGSCINNTGLILGVSSLILTISVSAKIMRKEMLMLVGVETILLIMSLNGSLSRTNGIILIILGILFIIYLIKGATSAEESAETIEKGDLKKHWIIVIFGLIGLIVSGQLIVSSSTAIAESFGIDQSAIGLTLVALGTTMPELMTSIAAARRKEDDMILGNIIGSNIFNILLVLGVSSAIHPIAINIIDPFNIYRSLFIDVGIMLLLTVLIHIIMLLRKKISWLSGILLLCIYTLYMFKQIYFIM
ncbi:MAG: calcium/sodium antiporter [Clostridia bacterium]|nr:calcium/sodium antiporter [Clostridia bacterium]